ncbi:MAG: HetP family heterocyst commitment protein [Cyanothece sp. SIO1E1]|nr:HetP family heterocyst commitment protein [Cyanothece sp. SIO1E1]
MNFHSDTKIHTVLGPEKFNQLIEAIIDGKYSWACVLFLRFVGYNPLDYMPYRTYNRLLKEHDQVNVRKTSEIIRKHSKSIEIRRER